MTMGGYPQPPFIYNGGMRKPLRGGKSQDYPQQQFPTYMYGGWPEPSRGFYGPPGYGSMPYMYRPGMDIIPTSGMDYITDQFQGVHVYFSTRTLYYVDRVQCHTHIINQGLWLVYDMTIVLRFVWYHIVSYRPIRT